MSRSARQVRRRRQREWERQAVAVANRIRGCTCRPTVEHDQVEGVPHVTVYHDADCAADTDRGPMFALGPGHRQTPEEYARDVAAVLQALRNGGP